MVNLIVSNILQDILNFDVILFGMGINNSMNNGFARDIKVNFPLVHEREKETNYGDRKKYGTVKVIEEYNKIFCACYFYKGGFSKHLNIDQLDYDSLQKCLEFISKRFKGKKIVSPILGVSNFDGNGDKEKILKIFNCIFNETDITLYDYIQEDYEKKYFHKFNVLKNNVKNNIIDKETYLKERNKLEWERINGIFKECPEDWSYKPKPKNKQIVKIIK